jgi:hypothetical protein
MGPFPSLLRACQKRIAKAVFLACSMVELRHRFRVYSLVAELPRRLCFIASYAIRTGTVYRICS